MSRTDEIIDWAFLQDHPLLWSGKSQIFCNAPISIEESLEILRRVKQKFSQHEHFPGIPFQQVVERVLEWGHTTAFSLGVFANPIQREICNVLDQMGKPYLADKPASQRQQTVLFLINNDDYFIADNFEIEVPEFDHHPEWCRVS